MMLSICMGARNIMSINTITWTARSTMLNDVTWIVYVEICLESNVRSPADTLLGGMDNVVA